MFMIFWARILGLSALGGLLVLLSGCASSAADKYAADMVQVADAVPKVEPKSRYGNPKSYVVFGKRYHTKASSRGHVEKGLASWYGKKFHGRKTSSGERYNMYAMTAAHKTLPLPTYARVTNVKNGRSIVVRVNDRGPFHGKRIIDLSYVAARKLGVVKTGTAMVEVRAIDPSRPGSGGRSENRFADAGSPSKPKKVALAKKTPAAAPKVVSKAQAEPAIQVASTSSKPKPKPVAAPVSQPKIAALDRGSKPSGASTMYLQVGAFGSRTNAEQLRRKLVNQLAERVEVRTADGGKAPLFKVHVGPLNSRTEANHVSEKLASLGLPKPHVVME